MANDRARLYQELADARDDKARAAAWHRFLKAGNVDGDVGRLRRELNEGDPAAALAFVDEEVSARAASRAAQI